MTTEKLLTIKERRADAERFYLELFTRTPRLEPAFVAIKRAHHIGGDPKNTRPADTIWLPLDCGAAAYADAVLASDSYDDVYTSVTPHTAVSERFGSQGTKATLCATQVLHFDLDAGKEGTPASQTELLAVTVDVFERANLPIQIGRASCRARVL